MIIRIKNLLWNQCSKKVKDTLFGLTLTSEESYDSLMRQCINQVENFKRNNPEIFTLQTPLRYDAWALVAYDLWFGYYYGHESPFIMLYVRPSMRRKGLGSQLLARVRYKYPSIRCDPWDYKSNKFYRKYNLLTRKNATPSIVELNDYT